MKSTRFYLEVMQEVNNISIMKKYIKYILLLAFVGAAFGFYMYNKPHKSISKAKTDIELSANQLFSDFELNEVEANTKYLDKIMEVEGKIKEISKDENGMTSITLEAGSEMFGVICHKIERYLHWSINGCSFSQMCRSLIF